MNAHDTPARRGDPLGRPPFVQSIHRFQETVFTHFFQNAHITVTMMSDIQREKSNQKTTQAMSPAYPVSKRKEIEMRIMPMGDYYVWYCEWCDSRNLTPWTRMEKDLVSCGACHQRFNMPRATYPAMSQAIAHIL